LTDDEPHRGGRCARPAGAGRSDRRGHRRSRRDRARESFARLPERESDVALAIAQGKSNAEIGAALYMSVATVKAHITRMLVKLELNNRVQVALLAHDAGLTGD
jgi:DNA-binding NarL/FixJ family response regulator